MYVFHLLLGNPLPLVPLRDYSRWARFGRPLPFNPANPKLTGGERWDKFWGKHVPESMRDMVDSLARSVGSLFCNVQPLGLLLDSSPEESVHGSDDEGPSRSGAGMQAAKKTRHT